MYELVCDRYSSLKQVENVFFSDVASGAVIEGLFGVVKVN